jgi:hypothetical protein
MFTFNVKYSGLHAMGRCQFTWNGTTPQCQVPCKFLWHSLKCAMHRRKVHTCGHFARWRAQIGMERSELPLSYTAPSPMPYMLPRARVLPRASVLPLACILPVPASILVVQPITVHLQGDRIFPKVGH